MERVTYHALLRTIVGQQVWITLYDDGAVWSGMFVSKYDKKTGEDQDGFGRIDLDTISELPRECW